MANADLAKGFQLITDDGKGDVVLNKATVDAANATAIFKNDPITAEADGNVTVSSADDGVVVLGVADGFLSTTGEPLSYLPATTAGTVLYIDPKGRRFKIQSDAGTTVAATAVYATANHAAGTGSTVTGISGAELDASDIGTGIQLRILGKDDDSTWGLANVNLIVEFNEYVGHAGSATI